MLTLGAAVIPFACRRTDDVLRGQSGSEGPANMGGTCGTGGVSDENPPCPCGADGLWTDEREVCIERYGDVWRRLAASSSAADADAP